MRTALHPNALWNDDRVMLKMLQAVLGGSTCAHTVLTLQSFNVRYYSRML